MLRRLLLLLSLIPAFSLSLLAQEDGPMKMTPELALAIPLDLKGHDVTLKYPILINRTTVLKPGMILRVLYIPPIANDSENLDAAHLGNMAQSFSRSAPAGDGEAPLPPEVAHALEGYRRTIWQVPVNFQLALAQLPTESLHLIYTPSSDNRHLEDQRLSFFEGLFLGSPTGGVTILAVENGSKSDQAGFKAGDQILAVGGRSLPPDLAAFPVIYSSARQTAKDYNAVSFPFIVRSVGETGSHTVNLAMPPTIKSQLMEGFH